MAGQQRLGVVFASVLNNEKEHDASVPESYRDVDEIEISRHRTFLVALNVWSNERKAKNR